MVAGNFKTYEIIIENTISGELDLSNLIGSEYLVKINPNGTGVRLLVTPSSDTTDASITDFLLQNEESEFNLGRGLSRLSFYNGNGSQVKVSIAVLF
jgi:hypothetical protein